MCPRNYSHKPPKQIAMGKKKKRYIASLAEVTIKREGDYAIIEYIEPDIPGSNIKLGPEIIHMTDQEILDLHNNILWEIQERREKYGHVAIEVPPGKPQIKYFKEGDQWVPRGDVLRCEISDGGPDGELTVIIDDRELSLRQFGKCLTTYAGWGMRIVFVPEDEICKPPTTACLDPSEEVEE